LIAISTNYIYAKEENTKWVKLNNYIYIFKTFIKKDKDSGSAWFKTYDSIEHDLWTIDEVEVSYTIDKFEAYCDIEGLYLAHYKAYDKNNRILYDEPNNHSVFSSYNGIVDGEIYYWALCKKDRE